MNRLSRSFFFSIESLSSCENARHALRDMKTHTTPDIVVRAVRAWYLNVVVFHFRRVPTLIKTILCLRSTVL